MPRKYSLYWRPRGERRWRLAVGLALPKDAAVRVFQNTMWSMMLCPRIDYKLRPFAGRGEDIDREVDTGWKQYLAFSVKMRPGH